MLRIRTRPSPSPIFAPTKFLATIALYLSMTAGCLGTQARQRVGAPALERAANEIAQEVVLNTQHDDEALQLYTTAIAEHRYADALAVWPLVHQDYLKAVNDRPVSEGVKVSLRERATRMDSLLAKQAAR